MKIGLIGTGTIGTFLLEKINVANVMPGTTITAVFDERLQAQAKLEERLLPYQCRPYQELEQFLQADIDIVVECATIDVVKKYAERIIQEKDLLLISVGALADSHLYKAIHETAMLKKRKVYLPSGAIGGLDAIKAAKLVGGLEKVSLVTRKPASALGVGHALEEKIIFEGLAKDAIANYPQNMNVAITLSLAGIGMDKTTVKIIADPTIEKNSHQITAYGDFGRLEVKLENNVSSDNPKTSYLTSLSILSTLTSLGNAVVIA